MARYVTTVRSAKTPREAFAYMADLRNFAEWDPGVKAVRQVEGSGGGPDAVFDVTVVAPGPDLTLRYVTEEHDAPRNLLVVARSSVFTSIDRITVEPDGTGSVITYDADLRLNGVLRVGDLGLRLVFGQIGDRAAAGLRRVLGPQIPSSWRSAHERLRAWWNLSTSPAHASSSAGPSSATRPRSVRATTNGAGEPTARTKSTMADYNYWGEVTPARL